MFVKTIKTLTKTTTGQTSSTFLLPIIVPQDAELLPKNKMIMDEEGITIPALAIVRYEDKTYKH